MFSHACPALHVCPSAHACLPAGLPTRLTACPRAALWNLAYRNNPNRKEIVLAGAIPLLVDLLKVGQGLDDTG